MNKLYIFPYCGTGLEVLDSIDDISNVVFVSDNTEHIDTSFFGVPIISREEFLLLKNRKIIAVHGSTSSFKHRIETIHHLQNDSYWQTIIHPSAVISKFANIGKNVFISAGVSIGPNVIVNDHSIILANSTIHHDAQIGVGSIICGNVLIAGNVNIGNEVYVGAGSTIKNGTEIGSRSLIGMGSVVLKNIGTNEVWFGNPAKIK